MIVITLSGCMVEEGRIYINSHHAARAAARRYGRDWQEKGYKLMPFERRCNCAHGCRNIVPEHRQQCDSCSKMKCPRSRSTAKTPPIPAGLPTWKGTFSGPKRKAEYRQAVRKLNTAQQEVWKLQASVQPELPVPAEQYLTPFVKLDPWHVRLMKLIRSIFSGGHQ